MIKNLLEDKPLHPSFRKNKTWEQLYGSERATKMKKEMSQQNKGGGNPFYGKRHSEESKQKSREKHLGKPSGFKGKQHTAESIQKNREKHLGQVTWNKGRTGLQSSTRKNKTYEEIFGIEKAEEIKDKLHLANTGKHHTDETKRKMMGRLSPIKNKTWDEFYGPEQAKEIREKLRRSHLSISGEKNPMYGKHHTIESKEKNRKSQLGKHVGTKNPMWGKPPTTKGKTYEENFGVEKAKELRQKRRETSKKLWMDDDYAKRLIASCQLRPTKPELQMQKILQNTYPDKWRYVGDGKVIIGGLCPDFIHKNEMKIIEIFGVYWHSGELAKKGISEHRTEGGRKEAFAKYGYVTLVIWDYELRDEKKVKERLENFIGDRTLKL